MFKALALIGNATRFADETEIVSKVTSAAEGFLSLLQSIVTPIAGIAIACLGFYLVIFGSEQRAWDTAKKIFIAIVVGIIVLYSASPIVNFITSIA